MKDPFEKENTKEQALLENQENSDSTILIYERERYFEKESPKPIYIPSRKLMLKIMRACIGVHDEKDLWFNKNN